MSNTHTLQVSPEQLADLGDYSEWLRDATPEEAKAFKDQFPAHRLELSDRMCRPYFTMVVDLDKAPPHIAEQAKKMIRVFRFTDREQMTHDS